MNKAALKYLQKLQQPHTKVNHIKYEELKTQEYLTSPLFSNEETKLLYAFRTRTVKNIKANFPNMYFGDLSCPLNCVPQENTVQKDTQQHLLTCAKLQSCIGTDELSRGAVKYEHLFGDVNKQKEAIVLLSKLIEAREKFEKDDPPGANLDPSTGVTGLCCDNGDLTCSVLPLLSYGK